MSPPVLTRYLDLTDSDVNARFSGISQDQLDKAVMDIQGVREACLMFIGPDTVLVGHGYVRNIHQILMLRLENDLRAVRILHDKIIDTAVVRPPLRFLFLLKKLTNRYSHTTKVIRSAELSETCKLSYPPCDADELIRQGKREIRYIHPRPYSRPRPQFSRRC